MSNRLGKDKRLRIKLILDKGGKCSECNLKYDGNNAVAFDFHHVDPEFKEFTIAYGIRNKPREEVIKEVKKCVLLCKVCHVVHHSGGY
jgi:hypothetical protein